MSRLTKSHNLVARQERRRILIVGTGYVGTANAIGFAELGHQVIGFDISADRITLLSKGVAPYVEAGINEALRRQLMSGRLRFTHDVVDAMGARPDVIVLALPTPCDSAGVTDLAAIEEIASVLANSELASAFVVLRSSVPPGTTAALAARLPMMSILYSPEFLREGFALQDFWQPSRTVIGFDDESTAERYASLLEPLNRPILFTSWSSAETIKMFSNAFLGMKISFANEVANFCEMVGADGPSVLAAIGADPRIGSSGLAAGIGFGGPCLVKDIRALQAASERVKSSFEMLSAALRVNELQPRRIIEILEDELLGLDGVVIGVWGLTFKAGTDDIRSSLALQIIAELVTRGAKVVAYDPSVSSSVRIDGCDIVDSALGALEADALVVLTEWREFSAVDALLVANRLRRNLVVDGRNVLPMDAYTAAGLAYRGIGRRGSPSGAASRPLPCTSGSIHRSGDMSK